MPTHLKKLVRSRMVKTGESYATALRYVRRRGDRRLSARAAESPAAPGAAVSRAPRVHYEGAVRRDRGIDSFVRSQPEAIGEIVSRLVSIARAAEPAHDEILFRGAPSFCIDGEPYCYLVPYARHVHLGFCDGTVLPDPDGLLEGRGKWMRHVKVKPGAPLPAAAISRMVAASARRVRALRSEDPRGAKEVRDGRR